MEQILSENTGDNFFGRKFLLRMVLKKYAKILINLQSAKKITRKKNSAAL